MAPRERFRKLSPVAVLLLLAVALAACDGGSDEPLPTPTPSPRADVSPLPDPSATPLPPLDRSDFRFLYSEFGRDRDIIWSAEPARPVRRTKVAEIPHGRGWAIKPALSPDGTKLAYNAVAEDGTPEGGVETYILDLESGESTLLLRGVELATPVWSPDGSFLFLRHRFGREVMVLLVDVEQLVALAEATPTPTSTATATPTGTVEPQSPQPPPPPPQPVRIVLRRNVASVLDYFPLGVDAEDGVLYFVQVQGGTLSGTFLGRYQPATADTVATATAIAQATATSFAATVTSVAQTATSTPTSTPTPGPTPTPTPLTGDVFLLLSDQIARDFALSPDASRVAYIVPGLIDGEFVARVHIADVAAGRVSPLRSPPALPVVEQIGPIWGPGRAQISVGLLPAAGEPGRVAVVPVDRGEVILLPAARQGFDQPLAWSPDGKFVAVRHFQGDSLANPGRTRLVFVSPKGQRPAAPPGPAFEPIGWVK